MAKQRWGQSMMGAFFFLLILTPGSSNDPNKLIQHVLEDISCKFDNFYMECTNKCWQKQEVEKVWNDKFISENTIIDLIKKYVELGEEPFSCNAQCQTNPDKTSCASDCTPDLSYVENCNENCTTPAGSPNKFDYSGQHCQECIRHQIEINPNVCKEDYMGRHFKCRKTIELCSADPRALRDKKDFVECIEVRQMDDDIKNIKQIEKVLPCYDPKKQVFVNSKECDDFLKTYLSKELCALSCDASFSFNNPFDKCKDKCREKSSPADCKRFCPAISECQQECLDKTADLKTTPNPSFTGIPCISRCHARVDDPTKFRRFGGKTWKQEITQDCLKEDFSVLKDYIKDPATQAIVFSQTSEDEYKLILKRHTPSECYLECGNRPANEKTPCITEFCTIDLNDAELKALCNDDPYRRRFAVLHAAASGKSLQTSVIETNYAIDFKDYIYDETDDKAASDLFLESLPNLAQCPVPPVANPNPPPGPAPPPVPVPPPTVSNVSLLCTEDEFVEDLRRGNAECLYNCYKLNRKDCHFKPDETLELASFATCRWLVDLSLSNSPDEVTASYFNEKVFYDQKDKLLRPNSHQYLQEVEDRGSKGFFVFPYFLIIRAECEGGYYDEAFYQLFMHGGTPSVEIQHWPTSPRDSFHTNFKGLFIGALLNLTRIPNHVLVPENELKTTHGSFSGCHWEICYPGFAVPLLLYRIPSFEVKIDAQDVFSKLTKKIYVSAYNSRDTEGAGSLVVNNASIDSSSIPVRKEFFPVHRITDSTDSELKQLSSCLNPTSFCPPIYTDPSDPYYPLDGEDFFMPQFTFGSAPTVAIAGLYDPALLIIGDPDMNNINLIKWTLDNPAQNVSILSGVISVPDPDNPDEQKLVPQYFRCLQGSSVKAGGFTKVMYTQTDRSDIQFPLNYYRVRLKPKEYERGLATQAIFDVISMEDRLLLVTARGLVTFYGNTNSTLNTNALFKAPDEERLEYCFKFVRSAQRVGMESDLVVGVTYDYSITKTDGTKDSVLQQIHVGEMKASGEKMIWSQIITNPDAEENEEMVPLEDSNAGAIRPLDPRKHGGVSIRELEDNAKSEVERICFLAYKTKLSVDPDVIIKDVFGWCVAVDAAPMVTIASTFLILVRMLVFYVGKSSATSTAPSAQKVYFYIIASHRLRDSNEQKVYWDITSIIPRIPCADEHKESVQNVNLFNPQYFKKTATIGKTGRTIGCHNINEGADEEHIYISRMTFTRMISNQLFLFGTRLILSGDAGNSFVHVRGFPFEDDNKLSKFQRLKHRIKVVTFDDKGHFAFLTNQRELWIGSTGDLNLIQLRPSQGYIMTQTIVSTVQGFQDGVPFSVMYDHWGELFELVAILSSEGTVTRIMKRRVPVALIIRNKKIVDEMDKRGQKLADAAAVSSVPPANGSGEVTYSPSEWELYCPFSSSRLTEDYSARFSRNQLYFFPPPIQHSGFGRAFAPPSLWAFQVATFSLIWKSVFNLHHDAYSQTDFNTDPFERWKQEKQETAKVGLLRFIRGDKDKDGVLVLPGKYKRLNTRVKATRLFRFYYLDYGTSITMELQYSIKHDASLGVTDYHNQRVSHIQMNVDNSNGTLLQVDTEKIYVAEKASVMFRVKLTVIKSRELVQQRPGAHLLSNHVTLHLIGGFGTCVRHSTDPSISDSLSTLIHIGCKPSIEIQFNWNKTLYSIAYRDKDAHFGVKGECYDNQFVCFFVRHPLVLFFDIFDITKQYYTPFTGNYILRVVGGGYSKDKIEKYTDEEQQAYNIPGVSDVSLVWNEWDLTTQKKVDRKPPIYDDTVGKDIKRFYRESILQSGVSAIQWACHTLSPCARIRPNINFQTVYWFRLSMTNKNVDNSTLCLYEKEFDIMLYGFPPSPEIQLLTTIIFCLCLLGILYLLFICCRSHKRVWRATKVKTYGWYQIIKDTFPKPLKTQEEQTAEEGRTQQQKDNIILSLQGHLKIPRLAAKGGATPVEEHTTHRSDSMRSRRTSSLSSIRSDSSTSIIDMSEPTPRRGPQTWVDLVYEQIISKRLAAIVEKNKKLRSNILKRAGAGAAGTMQEKKYAKEHQQTISEESFFSQSSKKPPKKN